MLTPEVIKPLILKVADMEALRAALVGCAEARAAAHSLPCRNHQDRRWDVYVQGEGRLCVDCYWNHEERRKMIQLVQSGEGEARDLMIWSMGHLQEALRRGAPKDTIVYYYNGAGSSSYMSPPTIEKIIEMYPPPAGGYKTVTIAGFSAGGRAVQRQLDNWFHGKGRSPSAVLIADGLHTSYISTGKGGERSLFTKPLESIVEYAYLAACEQREDAKPARRCVLWHSNIVPPGYASTKEVCEYIQSAVERLLYEREGLTQKMQPFQPKLDGREYVEALKLGHFYVIEYKGRDAKEHVNEAQMIDEAMREFCPWFSDDNKIVPGDYVYFPEASLGLVENPIATTLAEQIVAEALADEAAGIGEAKGRNNQGAALQPYFDEFGIAQPASWCAMAAGTWARRAARKLGLTLPITFSPGAKATMAQFQRAQRWIPIADVRAGKRDVEPGMFPVWDRSTPGKPETSWKGHIGVAKARINADTFLCTQGNALPHVATLEESINNPRLLGFGVV
jgi:hypothetical protein